MRGAGLRDTFVFNSQLGLIVSPRLTVGWSMRGVQPYDTGPIGTSLASASGLGDGVTYVAYGPSAAVRLNNGWSIIGGVDGGVHTRNLAAGASYHVGAAFSR